MQFSVTLSYSSNPSNVLIRMATWYLVMCLGGGGGDFGTLVIFVLIQHERRQDYRDRIRDHSTDPYLNTSLLVAGTISRKRPKLIYRCDIFICF